MAASAKAADIEEIRELIRSGYATSQIISMRKWPNELIKEIKSQELEADKKADRERVKAENEQHMANKRELHHQKFLERLGIDPAAEKAREKELADLHFAKQAKEKEEAEAKAKSDAEAQAAKEAEEKRLADEAANQQDTTTTAPGVGAEGNVQQ